MSTVEQAAVLARFARDCIREALGGPTALTPEGEWTTEPAATFVSLHWPDGTLQGCVGSLEPRRPAALDVATNALAAAFRDPRARGLVDGDVDRLLVEVSMLSAPEALVCADEAAAVAALRPGTDGVILRWHERRATFLPQVWTHLAEPRRFLAELKEKAGLPGDFWDAEVLLERYTVVSALDSPPEAAPVG